MCHQQTSYITITNLVDVNWTVTVINQRGLPPVLLMRPKLKMGHVTLGVGHVTLTTPLLVLVCPPKSRT